MIADQPMRQPWIGLIMMLNTETVDHRIVVDDDHTMQVDTREMPLPVLAETDPENTMHRLAMVGAVEWIRRHGNDVLAAGWLSVPELLSASHAYRDIADGATLPLAVQLEGGRVSVELGGPGAHIRRPWKVRNVLILRDGTASWPDAHLRLASPLIRQAASGRWG